MKSRWWFAPLILALLLFVGQAHADSIVNVAYNFETVISYECAHGNCEWVTRVHPLGLTLNVQSEGVSSDWVPLKTAILDQNGNTTREQLLGWVSATGCPSINYCIGDWLTNVQNCASDTSCTITWACENDGGTVADIHNIAGTCLTDNTGEYCPGSSTHVCGCAASIEGNPCPQLIPPAEPDDPWGPDPFTPYVIEEDEYGGWIYLAPCGADTPIGQDGQCDGTSTPCTNCDPMPYNNGNPINPE